MVAPGSKDRFLSGWKEIASYLGKGVRTVQRYEHGLALPIHRPGGKSAGVVFADKAELDRWLAGGVTRVGSMPKPRVLNIQANALGENFLRIDSEIALTFSNIALATKDPEKRRRASQTARKAHDTIMRLRRNIALSDTAERKLDTNLRRLKSELESLGYNF